MKQYIVEQINKSGSVTDVHIFDTKEEALEDLEFNRKFFSKDKWRMREEECTVLWTKGSD